MTSILVFGGTTEGRKAIEALEEAGSLFYYSTKTGEQAVTLQHGVMVSGAMDAAAMETFCREHGIGLLVDAAHPFAEVLHRTVAKVAERLGIPAIRFERIFPPRADDVVWLNGYEEVMNVKGVKRLLATTGVQSISRLKPLEEKGVDVFYRILPRESSLRLAHEQGANDAQLRYYDEEGDERAMLQELRPDAILLKESGETGGFLAKVAVARELGISLLAIKRPATPPIFHCVDGEHGLRRMVEKLLPDFYPLHSGLTTGTCATAAAVAAATRLIWRETPREVPVLLPNGERIMVAVTYGDDYASVVKEAGDDPDVTDGIEIRANVEILPFQKTGESSLKAEDDEMVIIVGGEGVGRFTLPGFDYPVGEAAINKGPREMITNNLRAFGKRLRVTINVPEGRTIAHKTFNPRLGIEGGISIIGVSGIVKPFSEEAFVESIRKCMTVAKASGAERVVIHSGAKSERFLHAHYLDLPQQAFVEYGNSIGETLKISHELGFSRVTLGIMLGKAVKLAEGHLDTHSRKVTMSKDFIIQVLQEAGCASDTLKQSENITLARELWNIIPPERVEPFCHAIIRHCMTHCLPLVPQAHLTILLIDDGGTIHSL